MAMKKIKYVQLEPQAWLADADWLRMDAVERGAYSTIILLLYSSGGKFQFDLETLKDLCRCENFEKVWEKIEKKFQNRNGFLKHKRVTKELAVAKKRSQAARRAGLKGAEKRWAAHSNPNGEAAANVNVKERNVIEDKREFGYGRR